jgi:hypothetical protein
MTESGRQPPKKLALQCFLRGREGLALARKTTFNGELHAGIGPVVVLTTGLRVSAVSPLTGYTARKVYSIWWKKCAAVTSVLRCADLD